MKSRRLFLCPESSMAIARRYVFFCTAVLSAIRNYKKSLKTGGAPKLWRASTQYLGCGGRPHKSPARVRLQSHRSLATRKHLSPSPISEAGPDQHEENPMELKAPRSWRRMADGFPPHKPYMQNNKRGETFNVTGWVAMRRSTRALGLISKTTRAAKSFTHTHFDVHLHEAPSTSSAVGYMLCAITTYTTMNLLTSPEEVTRGQAT